MSDNKQRHENDLTAKSADLAADAAELIEGVKVKASDIGHELKDRAQETSHRLKDKANNVQESLVEMVQAHPYRSLGAAFLAGIVIAKCMK